MEDVLQPLIFPARADASVDMFGFVVAERFRGRARSALTAVRDRGLLDPQEAVRLADAVDQAAIDRAAIWHFSTGLFDHAQEMDRSPARCADQLMVSLAAIDIPLSYRFQSRGTRIYTAQGHVIDPDAIAGIECRDGVLEYQSADGERHAAAAVAERPIAGIAVLPAIQLGSYKIDLVTKDMSDPFFIGNIEHEIMDRDGLGLQRFGPCLAGIEQQAQPYYSWCLSAISSIIPLGPEVTSMVSGSQGACPGQVYLSGTLSEIKTAEMLIHEASHQYFGAIEAVGSVTRRGSSEEFYSPVVGRQRPLNKLLLGYHAFANVLLYMKAIMPQLAGPDLSFAENNIKSVSRDLATLADGIEASTTLSEQGAYLWHSMKRATLAS